jgi:acetolactate synthase-1/3 small subunit
MRHVIAIFLQNEAGALGRVTNLFSTRGYNIESLAVAPTPDPTVSRLTLVTTGDDTVIGQVLSQLGKLLDVIDVIDLSQEAEHELETAMVALSFEDETRDLVVATITQLQGRVLELNDGQIIATLTAHPNAVDSFIAKLVQSAEVIDIARSGVLALTLTPRFQKS